MLVDKDGHTIKNNEFSASGFLKMYGPRTKSSTVMEWRYVCNDGFDMDNTATTLACRELLQDDNLNKTTGIQSKGTVFTRPENPWTYWDDIQCNGTEQSLKDCLKAPEAPNFGGHCPNTEAVHLTCKKQ